MARYRNVRNKTEMVTFLTCTVFGNGCHIMHHHKCTTSHVIGDISRCGFIIIEHKHDFFFSDLEVKMTNSIIIVHVDVKKIISGNGFPEAVYLHNITHIFFSNYLGYDNLPFSIQICERI